MKTRIESASETTKLITTIGL